MIINTHNHLLSTFALYRSKFPEVQCETAFDFIEGVYTGKGVEMIVNVWCEPEVFMQGTWKELVDGRWEGIQYRFVTAKSYTPTVESEILTLSHPSCVGLDVQQQVFAQQLRIAVDHGIPIMVQTREAEEDTERITKEIVPNNRQVCIHYFTNTVFGLCLLDYFSNLHIGVTGVVCYATNLNTAELLKQMSANDNNVYDALEPKQSRLPFLHLLIIPWMAEFVAGIMGDG
ncbi:hypothetical protein ARMGADRAFT_1046115 [Armillaria gallica]|uniref:Amidohydrolase-related domain-containing protein n=1 Tax=Armillaria gallica TaxID=47427 RepID=A0A2H3DVD4_ARMGA|nr:hypothetical protein ARMGADRAFT_1046115 [Armillaria gallica]